MPLGYTLIMEVTAEQTEKRQRRPPVSATAASRISGSAARVRCNGVLHVAHRGRTTAQPSMPSTAWRWPPAARTTARRVCGRTIIRTTTARSCSIPTATISRPSVTRRRDHAGAFTNLLMLRACRGLDPGCFPGRSLGSQWFQCPPNPSCCEPVPDLIRDAFPDEVGEEASKHAPRRRWRLLEHSSDQVRGQALRDASLRDAPQDEGQFSARLSG